MSHKHLKSKVDGCIPGNWMRIFYVDSETGIKDVEFRPKSIVFFVDENKSPLYSWVDKNEIDITIKVNNWIIDKDISLSPDNYYEIPDEHKAEFRLRFY